MKSALHVFRSSSTAPMCDRIGRPVRYLRLSLTPACAMRCVYCRPAAVRGPGHQELLSPDEIEGLVRHLVTSHAVRKVRLTGGEPTNRQDLPKIVRAIARIPGLEDLAMTTNGLTLARDAALLAEAGLRRVNISLDSLRPARFACITGVAGLDRVLSGIAAARDAGLQPIKLNCVVVRGYNDEELPDLVSFAAKNGTEIRFIELMPMGPLASVWGGRFVSASEIRRRIEPLTRSWTPLPIDAGAARRFRISLADGREAVIGFVSAMSCPFCESCDRIRIAADGGLYPCLMDQPQLSLLQALRPTFDSVRFDALLHEALMRKAREHPATGVAVMTHIGG